MKTNAEEGDHDTAASFIAPYALLVSVTTTKTTPGLKSITITTMPTTRMKKGSGYPRQKRKGRRSVSPLMMAPTKEF